MGKRFGWLLAAAGLFLAPSFASAQMEVPPAIFTGPLSHPRYESGGLYWAFDFIYLKTNRPLKGQIVGERGILDLDGSIAGQAGGFVGSREIALHTEQVRGPGLNQPGWDMMVGWRFESGVVVELHWRHLVQARYTAQASIIPPSFNVGNQFENTFLFAPVVNFTTDFAGNATNIPVGSSAAVFGIWNGASLMQIEYVQRYDIYGINARIPIVETDRWRNYGLFGPRVVWLWDRFKWRTVDLDEQGNGGPETTAIYSNTVSNRLYGIHAGFGNDWFLGHTPMGGFAFSLDLEGGLYLDQAKTFAHWDREDRAVGTHRSRRLFALSPAAEVKGTLFWYPWEAVSLQAGYDLTMYFNTYASHRPIDFNVGTVDPEYNRQFLRWYHGLRFGISFVF